VAAAAAVAITLAWAQPAQASHPTDADGLPAPCGGPMQQSCPKALAFLVNGFGGCCVSSYVKTQLEDEFHADVHVSNWNDILKNNGVDTIEPNGHPGCFSLTFSCAPSPRPYSDEAFIGQMQAAIAAVPLETKIILIGHSFGADSLLQVVQRVGGRRIDFLGLLDAVGSGGFRSTLTSWAQSAWPNPVPSNVEYVFNRWQRLTPFPLENPIPSPSGRVASNAPENNQGEQSFRKNSACRTKYSLLIVPQILKHREVPNDGCVRKKLVNALAASVFNPYPRVVAAGPILGTTNVLQLAGARFKFSMPIDATTFGVDDVAAPSTVTGVEVVPGTGNREFIVRFEPVSAPRGAAAPIRRVTIGPNILDADDLDATDHKPMDQNANLVPGESGDRYTFSYPPESRPLEIEIPAVIGLKMIVGLQQRIRRIIAIEVDFDRPLARSVATDLAHYRLVTTGRDGRFGTGDDRRIPVATATYDATRRSVSLVPAASLAANQPIQVLVIDGSGISPFVGVPRRP
jgi:hypothetical protein